MLHSDQKLDSLYLAHLVVSDFVTSGFDRRFFNSNNKILIKREPLVYTRARSAVQAKEKKKKKEAWKVQQQ